VVTDDGTLFTFGLNDKGQLGHSTDDKFVPLPLEVGLPDPVKHVAVGEHHTMCITSGGDVWAWGSNEAGQLGIGPTHQSRVVEPRLVQGLAGSQVTSLALGTTHSMALTSSGEVYTWGHGDTGALGHGPVSPSKVEWTPKLVRALCGVRVRSLCAGFFSSGCVDEAGKSYSWGHGLYWQLGHGEPHNEFSPRRIEKLNVCGSLSIGQMHAMATGFDGNVFVWGTNDHGTLGQGKREWVRLPIKQPQELKSAPHSKSVHCGWKHSLCVSTDGRLFTWGWAGAYNEGMFDDYGSGQLGHGDEYDKREPTQVLRFKTSEHKHYDLRMPFLKPWKVLQASAGRNHTAMLVEAEISVSDVA